MDELDREIEEYQKQNKIFERQTKRNLKGIELEKQGRIDEAIELYEENISDRFEGSHSYNRLTIIYRKRGQIGDEIRVLQKAIQVYGEIESRSQWGNPKKLDKFKKRLEGLQTKYNIDDLEIKPYAKKPSNEATKEALSILKTRYAKGELNRDEYLQMKKDIEGKNE